jgi:hypothetical protein
MYHFNSVQVHTNMEKQVTESVSVRNNKGMKVVKIRFPNGKSKTKKLKLSKKEVSNIKSKVFMPKLFQECHSCLRNSTRKGKRTSK